jgi:hypothetical protein
LNQKGNAGNITIPEFKLYYKAMVIKTAWFQAKNKCDDQWNRTEDPDTHALNYSHLTFDKGDDYFI